MSESHVHWDSNPDDVNVKYTYDSQKRKKQIISILKIAGSIFCWYSFSILAAIINKKLMTTNDSVHPLTLTFCHVLISCFCDIINMRVFHKKAFDFYSLNFDIRLVIRYIIPLSFAMMCAKFLTYTSYGLIPVSLTHTVKALTPFFNVFIIFLWTGESVSFPTLFSLIPIVFGVIYASVNEIEFNTIGFICALCSTIIGVWQSIYLKMLMKMGFEKNFVHLCNGGLSCTLLLPVVVWMEWRSGSAHSLQWKKIVVSAGLQYLSSISSYSAMFQLTSLSYSIASTFKRVSIIVVTSIVFRKVLSVGNIAGIVVATIGAVLYNIANKKSKSRRRLPSLQSHKQLAFEFSVDVK